MRARLLIPSLLALALSAAARPSLAAEQDDGECPVAEIQGQLDQASAEVDELQAEIATLKERESQLKAELHSTSHAAEKDLAAERQSCAEQLGSLKQSIEVAKEASAVDVCGSLENKLGECSKEKASTQKELREAKRTLEKERDHVASLKRERDRAPPAGEVGKLEEEISELRARLAAAEKAHGKQKEAAAAAEGKLQQEKAKHDKEMARLRERMKLSELPLHLIAYERGLVRAQEIADAASVFNDAVFAPGVKQALSELDDMLAPHLARAEEAVAPLRHRVNQELEKVRPQYEQQVAPAIEEARARANQLLAKAKVEQARLVKQASANYETFRARAVRTVRSQPKLAPHAETIIDTCIYLIVMIVVMLTARPILRLCWAVVSTVLYIGLCCPVFRCCFRCCCCCGGRRARPAPSGPAARAQPTGAPVTSQPKPGVGSSGAPASASPKQKGSKQQKGRRTGAL